MTERSAPGGVAWWPDSDGGAGSPEKSTSELRKFAVVVAVPLLSLGGYLLWQDRWSGYLFLSMGALLLLVAAMAPRALASVERTWMRVAGALSVVSTYAILTLTFFLIITPVGFLVRLFSRGGITLRADPGRESYWEPIERDGPASRSDRPF